MAWQTGKLHFSCCPCSLAQSLCDCRLGPQVVVKTYKGAEHAEILQNDNAVADLLDILTEDFSRTPSFLRKFWGSMRNYRSRGQFQ